MEFFSQCMESVFDAMNVRRSGPDDDKRTYIDMTMSVEIPKPDLVAAIDVSLVALLFDNARMAIRDATPNDKVYFPRQDIAFATCSIEDKSDPRVSVWAEAVSVKVKKFIPANEDGHGAKIKLSFSFEVESKKQLALLVELIGEPLWFIASDSLIQSDEPKKKDDVLEGQEPLFPEHPSVTISSGGKSVTVSKKQMDRALRAVE